MKTVDIFRVSQLIAEVSETEIMPRFRNLCAEQIHEKGPGDLVTEADVRAERALTRSLQALLPGSLVVGEEAVAADDSVLDRLDSLSPIWIIDPVDGTANFARGHDVFGVIVALVIDRQIVSGWIYDPVGKRLAVSELGQGAWLNDERMHCANDRPLEQMVGIVSISRVKNDFRTAVGSCIRSGSVAHDYINLASGKYDFTLYRRVNPWDHAAGVLMHAEAGGFTMHLTRRPYRLRPNKMGILSASSQTTWDSLASLIPELAV